VGKGKNGPSEERGARRWELGVGRSQMGASERGKLGRRKLEAKAEKLKSEMRKAESGKRIGALRKRGE